jgi:carboxyl-terminal processing protease
MKKLKKAVIIFAVIFSAFGLWSFVDNEFKIAKGLDIYFNLFKELNYSYVDDLDPEKLIQTSLDAMLESLDPYTTFIPESEMDNFKFQTTGKYAGIGALIRKSGDFVMIAEPYEGSPAHKAGLKAADLILEIDGVSTKDKDISKVSESLKGSPETEVEVLINRPGVEKPIKKKITRQKITIPNVPYYAIIKDSIGYIRLTNFTTDAGKDVNEALIQLKKQKAKAVILDLRNNPGGLLNEAVAVANVFVGKDELVVKTKGKVKDANKNYVTGLMPTDTIIPLAILVNRGSASASEIVAGAIQDMDRGIIVGQRTFGKGLVQQTRPLSYNTQLKVTTAKYYIPSGRCIQALDYTHKNEDGSVGYIPDSLISEFKTKNGRKVYDGGGVIPDIKVTADRLSDLAYNLYVKNIIFDFATEFVQKNDTISKVAKFNISDDIYNQFSLFMSTKDFAYKTKTEETLNSLIENAKKEKYYTDAENEIKQLKEKLTHDKYKDLETFRKEIAQLIKEEIVTRYFYQKGKIEASLIDDPELDKALESLNNKQIYADIISGKIGDLSSNDKEGEGKGKRPKIKKANN